jgi:1,4-alpha-glucan branching enzyme
MYAFSENYILPVSHDEVVHGKLSLLDKSFGGYGMKFAGTRLFMAYQMTFPGKKLTFMGCEYGPFREWDYENQLEWFMLDYDMHKKTQLYSSALNRFYLGETALWERDFSWEGFELIYPDLKDINVTTYRRLDAKGNELLVVLNFSPVVREGYTLYVPKMGRYEEVLTTDRYEFGGRNRLNEDTVRTVAITDENGSRKNQITLTLPALGGVVLKKQLS